MKTLKYFSYIVTLILAQILFIGCTPKGDEHYVLENYQTVDKYQDLTTDKQDLVRNSLTNVTIDEAEQFIESHILLFLEDESMFQLKDVVLVNDNLSLYPGENRKPLLNMLIEVNIEMDTGNMVGSKEIASEFIKNLKTSLQNNLYFVLKVRNANFEVYNQSGGSIYSLMGKNIDGGKDKFIEQDKDEHQVQTLAYDYNNTYDFLVLEKFGIVEDSSTLHISYFVTDTYFDSYTEEDVETFYDALVYDFISNEITIEYIEKNQLDHISVSFTSGNFTNGESLDFILEL